MSFFAWTFFNFSLKTDLIIAMKTNYHTHTEHCRHAQGLPKDYALEAERAGLQILGFSDHAPFEDTDYGYRMPFCELDEYIEEVEAAKESFSSSLKILNSLEIEYLPKYTHDSHGKNYYEELLTRKKMDYLLLGEHFFCDRFGKMHNITAIETPEITLEYAAVCKEAMETGFFKIMAHPDLFCINEKWGWNDYYEKATDILIEASAKTGVLLEYNANGLRRGKKLYPDGERFQYPHNKFWKKVKSAGIPAIVGSDCHSIDALWDSTMETAIQNLESMNIKRMEEII